MDQVITEGQGDTLNSTPTGTLRTERFRPAEQVAYPNAAAALWLPKYEGRPDDGTFEIWKEWVTETGVLHAGLRRVKQLVRRCSL
jgi:hypothetical protein